MLTKLGSFLLIALAAWSVTMHARSRYDIFRLWERPVDPLQCRAQLQSVPEGLDHIDVTDDAKGRRLQAISTATGVEVRMSKGQNEVQHFFLDLGFPKIAMTQIVLSKNMNSLIVWFQPLERYRHPRVKFFALGALWKPEIQSRSGSSFRAIGPQGPLLNADPGLLQRDFADPYFIKFLDPPSAFVVLTRSEAILFGVNSSSGEIQFGGDSELFVSQDPNRLQSQFNSLFWNDQADRRVLDLSVSGQELTLLFSGNTPPSRFKHKAFGHLPHFFHTP